MADFSFFILMQREFKIASRSVQQFLLPISFFSLVVLLFPLGLNPSPQLLQTIAPGILWVAALLAILLSLDNLFREDYEDGFLELLVLSPRLLALLLAGKVAGQWLIIILPLLLIASLFGIFLGLPNHSLGTLLISLLIGTPCLMLIGAIAAALTVGLQQSSVLITLLLLPLYLPVLIFGSSAVQHASTGLSSNPQLYMLSSLLILTLTLAPLAMSAAIKISLSQ